nr:MAG TPA: Large polyvalent protein associated domain 23 [Caudoviricetes sp.]
MPAPKFRMRGTTSANETEATQKKTSTAPKFRMRGAGGGTSPSLPTATSQTAGETTGKKKAGRPTAGGKLSKITSPTREVENQAAELRTLRDEAHQEFLNFRGAEITAGAAGMPTEPYTGQRYRTAEEAYQAWQDYDRQYTELRNRYYVEENEQQQARLAGDTSMQASFARADEIRGALNRIQTLEQTRAAAPGPMTEDAVSQAVREIAGQYGLSQEDSRDLTTVRKALEGRLLEETDRISAAGYDYERMTEYQKRLDRAAEAERQQRQTAAWAGEHPVLASLASVGASALQAIDIPRLIATGGGSEEDLRTYTPADPNAAIISNFVTGVRDTVSKKIEESTDWDLFGQNMASFLYNTGMSIGDSASQVALLGPWATYLMGASAASQQAVNVLERGGSNTQAFWGGLAAGAAEAVFEKFSVDRLLRARSVNGVKDLLRETAKQAGTEASEEMLTEVANILSDTAIMGESSDFEQLVAQYQLMGMDEDEARKQAYLDSVAQVVWAGVGGALSGAAMGGGLGGVDLAGRTVQQRQQQTTSRAIDDAYATMWREGLFSPAARQAAGQAQQRIDAADRREARAYNNYMGRPQRQTSQGTQTRQDTPRQEQRTQDTPTEPAGAQDATQEGREETAADPVVQILESGERVDQAALSNEQFAALADRGDMDVDAVGRVYRVDPAQHIDQRSSEDMGDRKINAFQFDHPEVHRYYSEAAAELLNELSVTEKGGQTLRLGDYQTGYEYRRTKRAAPERITVLLDDYGLSYDQIEKALDAIIHNHGQENIAAAKRVEFVLDDMLTNGYQSMNGYIPPNQDYINAKASIAGYVEPTEGGRGYLDGIDEAPVTAERTEQNGQQGAEPGDGVSDGDLGRLSGTGAGEQAGGVGTGAERGRGPTDTFRTARERQNSVHHLWGEQISSRDLGLPRGTDAKTLRIVPENAWDDGLRATADRVREETGLDTVFVIGGIQIESPDGARLVRGVFTGDRIIVQADNIRATPDQIADHEVFHDRAAQTPGLVRELEDRIREQYGPEELGRVVEQYIRKLRGVISVTENAGEDGTQAEAWAILEEIFADAYAGINAFSAHAERFNETVEQTMAERGVGRGSQNAAATDRTTGPPAEGRYSFGGETAQRADLEALDRAKEMERQGVAMETIFRETGWYTGADGKWRFEIDDSGMEYSRWGDLNRSDRAEYARFRELEGKFIAGSITLEEQNELRQLIDQGHGPGRAEEQQTLQLSDFVRHDELYQNYPQLRRAELRFADLPDGTYGTYNTEVNTITLDNSLRSSPEDTLVHEIQHAIQTAEGFSGGSSPEYWENARIDAELAASAARENLRLWLQDIGYRDYVRQSMDRVVAGEITLDQHWENLQRFKENSDRAREIAASEREVARYEERLRELDRMGQTAQELYRNTAGEIEARDAAQRRQMTPEQRRETMPNTGDENTVFADAGDSYSMQEPDAAAQEEADRLFFQGVEADTIRELTGLERTEDGDWRIAVDTAPAAAYDGGRTIDQRGGLDDGSEAERNAGDLLRAQVRGPEAVDAGVRREGIQENGGIQEEPGQRAGIPGWARGRVIDRPSRAAGIAAENAGRYGADAFVVEDTAIKEKNPNAWALTSDGSIYISDSIPAELADVVGYHEAVHAAKQNENESYLELLNRTDGEVSFGSQKAQDVINLLAGRRFNGADFLSLDDSQVKTVLDELNALVWGYHKADPENARAQFADMFRDYDAYIADLDAAMESGAAEDGDVRYSTDEDTAAAPSDNPLPSPDQERRSDMFRPAGMSDEQYNRLNEQWKSRPAAQRAEPGTVPEGFDSIDDYTAALEAAAEERMRNRSREEFEGSDALENLGIRIANSVGLYGNTQQLIENDRAAKSVRKEIKRAERRLQATDAEKNFASGVAAGIYGEADIPPRLDADTVMELADYYWAEKAVQNDLIREQRTKINRKLDEHVRRLMDGVDDTKTKVPAAVIMRNRTPERNMRRIFGNAKGDEINDYLFRPTQDNEAERIRFINRMHNEVRTFKDRNGKDRRLNKEERALVQLVIEGRAAEDAVNAMERSRDIQNAAENIKNARKLAGNDDLAKRRQAEIDASVDEAREFNLGTDERRLAIQYSRWLETRERLEGADTTIIGNAVEKYRELFNQLYDAANDFLVAHGYEPIGFIRGYAPHLQSQETQERFNSALERMGINREIGKLPTSIAGRTKNFKPNMPWNGFFKNRNSQGEFLDPDIAEGFEKYVDSMSDVLYHTDDIMRTRAFVRYFRRTYAPEEIRNQLEQADALRYAQTDRQASFLRDKGKLSYTSAPTYEDVHQAMEQYVEDQYQAIENLTLYGDLAVFLDDYANNLANKQLFEDRAMEKSFGRTSLNAISRVHRAFARAQVSANLSSALNQGGQLPIILAENGTRNVAQALIELRSKDLKSWAAGSDFLTEKKGINYIVTSWKDRAITGAFKPLEIVDGIVSTLAVRSRYLKEVRAGKSAAEAMRLADRFGREVMASRAKGSVPLAFRSKDFLNQMVHMFQLEALNNWEHVIQDLGNRDFRETERTKGKRAAARSLAFILGKIILGAFLLNRLDEWLYGGTPAPFDFLGLAGNLFAGGLGLTQMDLLETLVDNGWERLTGERLFGTDAELKEFDAAAAFDDFVWNGINEIPFASNVASLLGVGDRTLPMPDFSRLVDLPKAISEDGLFSQEVLMQLVGLAGDVLPGGRQIEKSAQGLLALGQGGYYRGSGEDRRLQFPVEQDFWSIVRGSLFGRSALDESRDFYASGQTGLSANQTKAYEQIVDMGADPGTVYQAIQGWRTAENDEDLTSYGRNVAKRDAITEADLTDEQKLALYRGLSDADSSTPDHFREMMDTGLSWEEVMEAYDQYQFLNSDEDVPEADRLSATEKATEFASWVDRQNYTEDQAETVKEALRYWKMIPAEASQKVLVADEYGISNSSRNAVSDEIDRLKGDGNSVTQDLAEEAIQNVPGLSNRERAVLWQLQNKSWKWNKNPFDKRVGREVYDRMHEEDEN